MSSPFPPYLAEANPLAEITRCIRQICLLREQDNATEAQRIEQNEFANTLRDLRLAHGPDLLPESELRAMFAAEQKRVADAVVLSELLIPQLVKSFGAVSPVQVQPANRPISPVVVNAREAASPASKAAPAGVSPAIADLLDAMLASERGGRRPLSSASS